MKRNLTIDLNICQCWAAYNFLILIELTLKYAQNYDFRLLFQ